MIGAISSGARFAVMNSLATQLQQASALPAPPSSAAALSTGPGPAGAQPNRQPAAANAITAPEGAVRADLGAPPKPGAVQRVDSLDPLSFPNGAGSYHAAQAVGPTPAPSRAPEGLSGPLKGMVGSLQDEFAEMQRISATPIKAPDVPGGDILAQHLNDLLRYQQLSLQYEMGMMLGGHVEKTSQKMISKITDMKD